MATQDWAGFLKDFGAYLANPFDWTPPPIPGQDTTTQNPTPIQILQTPTVLTTTVPGSVADTTVKAVEAAPAVGLSIGLGVGAAAVVLALLAGKSR